MSVSPRRNSLSALRCLEKRAPGAIPCPAHLALSIKRVLQMDRRELLQLGAAALATASLPGKAMAQTPGVPANWKNSLNAYSRTLHWVRTPEEVAEVCHEIGNTTIDLTVRDASAGSA